MKQEKFFYLVNLKKNYLVIITYEEWSVLFSFIIHHKKYYFVVYNYVNFLSTLISSDISVRNGYVSSIFPLYI